MRKILIISVLMLFCMMPTVAQTEGASGDAAQRRYEAALLYFNNGQFDEADAELLKLTRSNNGLLRSGALRLLALGALERGDDSRAEEFVTTLLQFDPYFQPTLGDSQRFIEMVDRLKVNASTITTASQQAETLEEVPVPVTLITEEMIHDSGAENLAQLLATYVPGISIIEGNAELNLAMHGVYGSNNSKMLIMLNSHRMNSHSTNAQSPDYSISLDKVKQIEVLRGPASSLYGNVALTAVVNIITKDGKEIEGCSLAAKYGNFNTAKIDGLLGFHRPDIDLVGWASAYNSSGQRLHYDASSKNVWRQFAMDGNVYLGAFNQKPSYDAGIDVMFKNIELFSNIRYGKMQTPYTFALTPRYAPYDYDRYQLMDGQRPGRGRQSWNNELTYNKLIGKVSFDASLSFDYDRSFNYDVIADSLLKDDGTPFIINVPAGEVLPVAEVTSGVSQFAKWEEYTLGLNLKVGIPYGDMKKRHYGNILVGIQGEYFNLFSTQLSLCDNYERILVTQSESNQMIKRSNETSYAAFLQVKHFFTPQLILNCGLRYDLKYRFDYTYQHALSPRLAFIYNPHNWNFKLSASRSFVEAPYFNRGNTTPSYRGSAGLRPENNYAVQFTISHHLSKTFVYEVNAFLNYLNDLIYYQKPEYGSDKPAYINAGSLSMIGLENTLTYNTDAFRLAANFTWQRKLKNEKYLTTGRFVNGIPEFVGNIVVAKSLYNRGKNSLWAHANVQIYSAQKMPLYGYRDGVIFEDHDYTISASCIPNVTVNYRWGNLEFEVSCRNLFDTSYYRGSSYNINVPQMGRRIIGGVKYKF